MRGEGHHAVVGQCAGRSPLPNTRLEWLSSDGGVSCCWGEPSWHGLVCKGGGCRGLRRGRVNRGQASLRMRVGGGMRVRWGTSDEHGAVNGGRPSALACAKCCGRSAGGLYVRSRHGGSGRPQAGLGRGEG